MASHRIFVVEDEEMIRDSIVEFLDEQGYDAVGAADGRDALDKLAAAAPRPCLILLDLMMPVMDGRAFREQQLKTPELAEIPIIVFSAYRDVARTAADLNAAGHLEKPLRLTDLLETVRRHCTNGGLPA
jgi:CheY-like chemotaxis protein